MTDTKAGKTTAVIAYLTIVGALIAISMNSDPKHKFARFHTRQAFGLHLIFLGCALFLSQWYNDYAWYGLYTFYIVLWVYGFVGALSNKEQEVPILGSYFQKWFTFIP
ncbi:MAG: hypothetical protein COA50_13475 [Flavobacteriaceae bacterium]|nr:MAG: hypothetical protein COA50_13475 [Flavobacteriaceae bacterium]